MIQSCFALSLCDYLSNLQTQYLYALLAYNYYAASIVRLDQCIMDFEECEIRINDELRPRDCNVRNSREFTRFTSTSKVQCVSMKLRQIGRWLRLIPTIVPTVASASRRRGRFSTRTKTNCAFSRHIIISNYRELTAVHTFYAVAPARR